MSRVQTGLEVLISDYPEKIRGARIGVVCHPASVDAEFHHVLDLLKVAGARITAVFGPEHGARGEAQDMEGVDDVSLDPRLKVPVYSLYGATLDSLTPGQAQLQALDALVIDLQDVGARYYTFVWTMALCMDAAGKAGVRVLVCDRPNPLNGVTTEGNMIKPGFESFVGLHPLPNRHGLTAAEIARYVQTGRGIACELDIIPMRGWQRAMYFDQTGLPWVYPSPNMPTLETALVYPGMCLVEATELSEGRGTCRPFELAGAPDVDPEALATQLSHSHLAGCLFRPVYFRPGFQKHANTICGGVQIHVTDRQCFDAYATGIAFLQSVKRIAPEAFVWREKPYEFVADIPAIDLLTGDVAFRQALDAGTDADLVALSIEWQQERAAFEAIRQQVFLYGGTN
ncbi:MAG: hypothetical protein CSA09_04965 [Candidatus Contendobacter odensis]|uniref:DUF1343 domain-containing protein n=1 Tax=Candidatus Contendibacter odensensis TaxID=1400860 RepID=A0A2G6PEG1_9GAMM|nr:MAG: hypothetical protein CSA09_04965 [Candidatus Contendobacter odensis]